MKFSIIGPLCAALLVVPAAVGRTSKQESNALTTIEKERFEMTVSGDWSSLDKRLADDLTYCHSNGLCETKAQYLGNLKSGATRYRKMELIDAQVRNLGAVAVVNGQVRIDADMGGNSMTDLKLVYTDVYRRDDGRWRLIAWHSSRLP